MLLAILMATIGSYAECPDCGEMFRTTGRFDYNSPEFKRIVRSEASKLKIRLSETDYKSIVLLLNKENPQGRTDLKNPRSTAWGLPQALRSTYRNHGHQYGTVCPYCQINLFLKYVKGRYGNPTKAWQFWSGKDRHGKRRRYY